MKRRVVCLAAAVSVMALVAGCGRAGSRSYAPLTQAPVPAERSPLTWPFAAGSIWNTPLGAAAATRPANLTPPHVDLDVDRLIVTTAADPLTPTYLEASFTQGRCSGTQPQPQATFTPALGAPIHVPTDLVIPDATTQPYSTPNDATAFLDPDGHTLRQFDVTARCTPGGPLYGYRVADTDIRGDGRLGGHLGSGLSSIGGDVRAGELFGTAPLDHALKIELDGAVLAYAAGSATPGFRWPATLADGDAATAYQGHDPALVMGSLLSVPIAVTAASLGLRTDAGRRLLAALQHYGAYVADTTGLADASLCVGADAVTDYQQRTGTAMSSDPLLQDDLVALMRALLVVTDDGPRAVGGPGWRLAAPAPPLAAS